MTDEVIHNVESDDKSVDIRCNWCLASFRFTEKANQYVQATNCPWCQERVTIPRQKLRRLNGHNPGRRR